MKREGDVIVFLEPGEGGGEGVNQGLLTEGARVAASLNARLGAVTCGLDKPDTAPIEGYGASILYSLEGEGLAGAGAGRTAIAAASALQSVPFRLLLMAHSDWGADLAPMLAAGLGTTAVTDCVDIRAANGDLLYVRHLFGGQLEQAVSYAKAVRELATIRIEALDKREKTGAAGLEIRTIPVEVSPSVALPAASAPVAPDFRTVDIVDAGRIIGVGSGSRDSLAHVDELAELLEAAIGTTRVVVDDGFFPKKRMIGQTGKTVAPGLYLALGVSGSPHHVAGIQGSKEVLSVNTDSGAPIFGFSDKGFVADLRGLLPKLIERIKRYRDEGLS
jgi:electron transfer flavoprotein alpha subunit